MTELTTLAKVKSYMGITDSSSDVIIADLIRGVSAYVASYCGREFGAADYVETYDSKHGRHKIFLKQIPVNTIAAVKYRSGTPSTPIWITYNVDSYLPYLKPGYIHFYGTLPAVAQGFQISYNAGYLIDWTHETDPLLHTLPADLTLAVNDMISTVMNTRKAGGITNETTEGQSITYDFKKAASDMAKATLSNYRIYRIAA